jgi:hypothetical protein
MPMMRYRSSDDGIIQEIKNNEQTFVVAFVDFVYRSVPVHAVMMFRNSPASRISNYVISRPSLIYALIYDGLAIKRQILYYISGKH